MNDPVGIDFRWDSCLMCMEGYAKSNKNKKHHCHRDILADIILNNKSKDSLLLFERRIDK